MNKIAKFLVISEFNGEFSKFINITEFEELKLGNGGSWCRLDGPFGQTYKVITIKGNKKIRFSWDVSKMENETINNEIKNLIFNENFKKNAIIYIKIYGVKGLNFSRQIRKDIIEFYKNKPCVSCGTTNNIEVDHKNGLYNDKRVLNIKTQELTDFQSLCKHCNCVKRESIKKSKLTGKKHFSPPHVNFYDNEEEFDISDINALVNTYWYDPIKYVEHLIKKSNLKN